MAHWDIIVLDIGNSYQMRAMWCIIRLLKFRRPFWISAPLKKYEEYTVIHGDFGCYDTAVCTRGKFNLWNWNGNQEQPIKLYYEFSELRINHEELTISSLQKVERQSAVSVLQGVAPTYIFVWVRAQLHKIGSILPVQALQYFGANEMRALS